MKTGKSESRVRISAKVFQRTEDSPYGILRIPMLTKEALSMLFNINEMYL